MQILLVEDDTRISDFIVKGLQENGYAIQLCPSAEEARLCLEDHSFDLLIIDIMLPGIDGIQLTRLLRYKKNRVPILILSALSDTVDKIQALDAGADDYLVKPFHFQELLARLKALQRRSSYQDFEDNSLSVGNLIFNFDQYTLTQDGRPIELSPREFKLARYLVEHKNKVVTRRQILLAVWGLNFDTNSNVVDVYISYLRTKIDESQQQYIHTVKGIGYMLKG
ncbi:response regulator transcription factor [Sphingobacteriaceae bacterium WQ 2009]|uniref:Response regulator transcription factor n=1 Tax=Rhinopithecimicrobium faecis TaxID=2820698 RepID=A0A8T4HBI7_9SPHI|nr:response regulator transcription factor [Sphingobacteriaceae bacterium WQ 2009]